MRWFTLLPAILLHSACRPAGGAAAGRCLHDSDCAAGEQCLDARCVAGREPCRGEGCAAACVHDTDCGPPLAVCAGGRCVPGCAQADTPLACTADEQCSGATGRCARVSCALDEECGPPAAVCAGGRCAPGCAQPGAPTCPMGQVCVVQSGRCEPAPAPGCAVDQDCAPPATACDPSVGRCVPGCGSVGCPADQLCQGTTGRCVPRPALPLFAACAADAECASDLCFDSGPGPRCLTTCGRSADCAAGSSCTSVDGARLCLPAGDFGGSPSFSKASGESCAAHAECRSNLCAGGACLELCSEDGDCASQAGGECAWYLDAGQYRAACVGRLGNARPGDACRAHADCESGVCLATLGGGRCGDLCDNVADCPSDQVCGHLDFTGCADGSRPPCTQMGAVQVVKSCYAWPHGQGAVGAGCAADTDCRSGWCWLSLRQCVDLCSTDDDCPASHACKVDEVGILPDGRGILQNVCLPRA